MTTPAYQQFQALMRRNAFHEASSFAERQSLAAAEGSEFWLTQQARAQLRAGQPGKALENAVKALRRAPANRYALLARADALVKLDRRREAIGDYRELLSEEKLAPQARRGILECLGHDADWAGVLQRVSEWNLPAAESLEWRVKALAATARQTEAIEACQQLLRLQPDHPHALWQLTELQIDRDGLQAVLKRMERLARIPGAPPIYGEIHASLARRAGNPEVALQQYARLVKAESNPRILRKQAFALAKSGGESAALPLLEELLRLDPHDMYVHSSYVAACKRIHQLERAWKFYQELIGLHPEEKTLLGRLRSVQKQLEKE
jgi:tetratricopeptide (TPR) repeat protein